MRNKKKVFSFVTLVAIVASMSLAPIFADTKDGKDIQSSEVNVTFKKKETEEVLPPVDPVDPTDPEGGGEGDGGTGSKGNFTIDAVPKLNFGPIELDGKGLPATIDATSDKPYVQVSDRRQTGAGWQLNAKLSDFTHTNGVSKISGATITLKNGEVKKVNSESTAPELESNIVINGTNSLVMQAKENGGLGTWIATWLQPVGETLNKKVTLDIPTKDAIVGDYTAEITWTLSEQP